MPLLCCVRAERFFCLDMTSSFKRFYFAHSLRCWLRSLWISFNQLFVQRWVGREHTKFVEVCCSKEHKLFSPPSSSLCAKALAKALQLQRQSVTYEREGVFSGLFPFLVFWLTLMVSCFHFVLKQFCLFRTSELSAKARPIFEGARSTMRHLPLFAA